MIDKEFKLVDVFLSADDEAKGLGVSQNALH